jgi:hypothetical protein
MSEETEDITLEEDSQEISPIKRDEKGRWVKGNPPGPGRPEGSISLTTMIKQKLMTMSPDRRRTALEMLAENIIQDALESNDSMRRYIWDHLDGKAAQKINIDAELSQKKLIKLDE